MFPAVSTLPSVIDALLASFHALFDPLEVVVLDGPEPVDSNPNRFAAVGYSGDPDEEDDVAATFDQQFVGAGGAREEHVNVTCCVAVLNEASTKAARDAACALFAQVLSALAATPQLTLTATTLWIEVIAGSYHPLATETGSAARVVFTVHAYSQN